MDARFNLPERKYSYLLQDLRMLCQTVETGFESSSTWVKKHLDLGVAHRPIQRMVRDCTEAVEEFMESLPRRLRTLTLSEIDPTALTKIDIGQASLSGVYFGSSRDGTVDLFPHLDGTFESGQSRGFSAHGALRLHGVMASTVCRIP